jgi:hypothetical protein
VGSNLHAGFEVVDDEWAGVDRARPSLADRATQVGGTSGRSEQRRSNHQTGKGNAHHRMLRGIVNMRRFYPIAIDGSLDSPGNINRIARRKAL